MGKRGSWFTNGKDNIILKDSDSIPDGFYKGRTLSPLRDDIREEANRKKRKTCLQRYGVENVSQSREINDRKIKTSMEHYGTEYPIQSDIMKEKREKTCMEKYGVRSTFQGEFREKAKRTNLEKYGVECTFQSKELMKGVDSKRIKTNLERYGVENPSQSQEIKEKKKESYMKHYGVDHPSKVESVHRKKVKSYIEKYGVENPAKSKEIQDKMSETNIKRHGVYWFCQHHKCRAGSSNDSSANREFEDLLEASGIEYEREFNISRYSYDFKVSNTLIEIDPFPYHNSLWGPFGKCKSEDYHQKKSQTAIDNGYSCIHVFDWDDKSKIIDLLKPRERLYARNLTVFGIDNRECREYLNQYHLQGTCNGQSIRLGLRDRFGNLISLMTFGKPRYNKNYQYELLRYCTTANVIGGAEKLFKHFIKEFNPESIISYCDKSKFRGDVYSKLGFKLLSDSRPSKHWYSPNTYERMQHITDNFLRQRGYDQIFDADFGKGTSNEELIIARGYLPIFDCGQSTYIWSSK